MISEEFAFKCILEFLAGFSIGHIKKRCTGEMGFHRLTSEIVSPIFHWFNGEEFPTLALGHENEKLLKFQNKIGLKYCKWSDLNAPGTQSLAPQSSWENWELGNKGNGLWGMKMKSREN